MKPPALSGGVVVNLPDLSELPENQFLRSRKVTTLRPATVMPAPALIAKYSNNCKKGRDVNHECG
jgi:hypothetical protein